MNFYIVFPVLPAIASDIFLTRNLLNQGKAATAAFATVPIYFFIGLLWTIIVGNTVPAFSGQGALGLSLIMGLSILSCVCRLIVGLILFLNLRH